VGDDRHPRSDAFFAKNLCLDFTFPQTHSNGQWCVGNLPARSGSAPKKSLTSSRMRLTLFIEKEVSPQTGSPGSRIRWLRTL
jgi:hypothetical protein